MPAEQAGLDRNRTDSSIVRAPTAQVSADSYLLQALYRTEVVVAAFLAKDTIQAPPGAAGLADLLPEQIVAFRHHAPRSH